MYIQPDRPMVAWNGFIKPKIAAGHSSEQLWCTEDSINGLTSAVKGWWGRIGI